MENSNGVAVKHGIFELAMATRTPTHAPITSSTNTNTITNCSANATTQRCTTTAPSWRRADKLVIEGDERTDEERAPIFVNLAEACGLTPARLLAVCVFLSVVTVSSKQLVSYMKNVWKIRGSLKSH
ncbi:hypothetical protein ACUV84_012243 [Puccinellia chinampoensis]